MSLAFGARSPLRLIPSNPTGFGYDLGFVPRGVCPRPVAPCSPEQGTALGPLPLHLHFGRHWALTNSGPFSGPRVPLAVALSTQGVGLVGHRQRHGGALSSTAVDPLLRERFGTCWRCVLCRALSTTGRGVTRQRCPHGERWQHVTVTMALHAQACSRLRRASIGRKLCLLLEACVPLE